jgi:hypothetical protein
MAKKEIPVFLGCDPLGYPEHNPIGGGQVDDEKRTVTITVDVDALVEALPRFSDIEQIRGLSFNLIYAAAHKKENNGGH